MFDTNTNEIIDNIETAINLLKYKKVLFTNHLNNKTLFVERKGKVLMIGVNNTCFLTYDQFKDLYSESKFIIYEESDENFDFSRDDEYYSWKHK